MLAAGHGDFHDMVINKIMALQGELNLFLTQAMTLFRLEEKLVGDQSVPSISVLKIQKTPKQIFLLQGPSKTSTSSTYYSRSRFSRPFGSTT